MKVESFALDHTKVKAPFIRKCCVYKGQKGDVITKFDIRFMQPNKEEMQSDGIHTLEHLLATHMRDYMDGIIDLSPMGCRTGFYMTAWDEPTEKEVASCVLKSLEDVLKADSIPADNEVQCGNYKLHSLENAKKYAKKILDEGLPVFKYED